MDTGKDRKLDLLRAGRAAHLLRCRALRSHALARGSSLKLEFVLAQQLVTVHSADKGCHVPATLRPVSPQPPKTKARHQGQPLAPRKLLGGIKS